MQNGSPKIICVGFQKTGTSSLRHALNRLGYKTVGYHPRILIPILRGKWDKVLECINQYDAVADNPWPFIYKELDDRIPNSKFILTLRDENKWFDSVSKHIGNLRNPVHEWVYGHNKGVPKYNRESVINTYRKHNSEVIEYFKERPGDLLILDLEKGDGWEKLCPFLNKPIPSEPFIHVNKAEQRRKKSFFYFRRKKIKFWMINQYLYHSGLLK